MREAPLSQEQPRQPPRRILPFSSPIPLLEMPLWQHDVIIMIILRDLLSSRRFASAKVLPGQVSVPQSWGHRKRRRYRCPNGADR
jgi:hypothetical protein